jgi:predicted O-methyltransferase YrrM
VRLRLAEGLPLDETDRALLHRGYWSAFRASKLRGIALEARERGDDLAVGPALDGAPTAVPHGYSSPGLARFLAEVPSIHGGGTITWGLGEDALRFLDATVGSGARTLETGSGLSTLVFAFKGAVHTCITPDGDEIERLRRYCAERGVSTERLAFVAEKSQEALPRLDVRDLDLVLVDGGHGFPVPFLDWFFAARKLKVGGIVIVDDTQLWTGEVLRDFLLAEPEWRLEARFARGAAFRKVGEKVEKEWNEQPYVFDRSESPGRPRRG